MLTNYIIICRFNYLYLLIRIIEIKIKVPLYLFTKLMDSLIKEDDIFIYKNENGLDTRFLFLFALIKFKLIFILIK